MRVRLLVFLLLASGALTTIPGLVESSPTFSQHAGLVVGYSDGTTATACVDLGADGEATGDEVLFDSGLPAEINYDSGMGAFICKIGDEGCPVNDCLCQCRNVDNNCRYWAYYHLVNGAWRYSALGAGNYTVRAGDVEGWAWGEGTYGSNGSTPPVKTFDQICIADTPTVTLTPSPRPTSPPTATVTPSSSPTPSPTATATPSSSPTLSPTNVSTTTSSPTATPTNVSTTTPSPTATPTSDSSAPPAATATRPPEPTATLLPSPSPSPTPSPSPLPDNPTLASGRGAGGAVGVATSEAVFLPLIVREETAAEPSDNTALEPTARPAPESAIIPEPVVAAQANDTANDDADMRRDYLFFAILALMLAGGFVLIRARQ